MTRKGMSGAFYALVALFSLLIRFVRAPDTPRRVTMSVTGAVGKLVAVKRDGALVTGEVLKGWAHQRIAWMASGLGKFYSHVNPLNFGAGALRGLSPLGAAAA